MEIVWDPDKAAANPKLHQGVTFREAKRSSSILLPLTREDEDARGEQRFVTLGMGGKGRILVVVYAYHKETIRLISAWKANAKQRRRYEKQFK